MPRPIRASSGANDTYATPYARKCKRRSRATRASKEYSGLGVEGRIHEVGDQARTRVRFCNAASNQSANDIYATPAFTNMPSPHPGERPEQPVTIKHASEKYVEPNRTARGTRDG